MQSITAYFSNIMPLTAEEVALLERVAEIKVLRRRESFLNAGMRCTFVAFIEEGAVRHFHVDDQGNERTCDINAEGNWVTDTKSFSSGEAARYSLQALTNSRVAVLSHHALQELYTASPKFETIARVINERIVVRLAEISEMLILSSPEQRYQRLMEHNRLVFEQAPRKYIAHLIGIAPESFSRLSKRMMEKK